MTNLSRTKIVLLSVFSSIFCVSALLTTLLLVLGNKNANAFDSSNTTGYVTVGELWDSNSNSFNRTNFSTLLKYISSDSTINGVNTSRQTAEDIRAYTYNGKSNGQAVVVTLGGYKWQVVYLTRTNNTSGDRVATLLMLDVDGTSTYGNNSLNYGANSFTSGYPTSMYGTSYIRAVTLNNGGPYVKITSNSSNPTSTTTASQSSSHKYAIFTVEKDSEDLTDYLCKPNNVWYQKQSQGNTNATGYVLMNESLATNLSGYYSNCTYQNKTYYTQWGQDYLWLPSLSETGSSDSYKGIWELSTTERATTSSKASYFWSRSGYCSVSRNAYTLYASGGSYDYYYVRYTYGVRAALHLNLDSAALRAAYTVTTETDANSTVNTSSLKYDLNSNEEVTIIFSPEPQGMAKIGSLFFNSKYVTISASEASAGAFLDFEDLCKYKCYRDEDNNVVLILKSLTGDMTVSCTSEPIPINVILNGGEATQQLSFNFDTNDGELVITPTEGNYVFSALLTGDGNTTQYINKWSDILYQQSGAFMVTYYASAYTNKVKFYFDEVTSPVTITLTITNVKPDLQEMGGANINGVVITANLGGEARVNGFDATNENSVVHISAVAYKGYTFVGWVASDGTDLSAYGDTADIPYSVVKGKIITAQFIETESKDNSQTNNQDEIL